MLFFRQSFHFLHSSRVGLRVRLCFSPELVPQELVRILFLKPVHQSALPPLRCRLSGQPFIDGNPLQGGITP